MLLGNSWTNYFCRDADDELVPYSKSHGLLLREFKISNIRYASSISNEELALKLIRETIDANSFDIANWLYGQESSLGIIVTASEPIGLVIHRENRVQNFSSCAIMSLRKADEPCKNRSGFYVDRIVPISEVGEL